MEKLRVIDRRKGIPCALYAPDRRKKECWGANTAATPAPVYQYHTHSNQNPYVHDPIKPYPTLIPVNCLAWYCALNNPALRCRYEK
jgi:hypothetical protein